MVAATARVSSPVRASIGVDIRGSSVPDDVLSPRVTPWPAPADAPVMLFGGSFDPPHLAHLQLALEARDRVLGDRSWLILVPAARSPHKQIGPGAGPADRLAMLGLMASYDARTAVWTDELDRADPDAPSFWWQTLCRAASLLDDAVPIRFLIGADQALAFDRWMEHELILRIAEPSLLLRAPCDSRDRLSTALGDGADAWLARLASDTVIEASSTDVRALIARGDWGEAGRLVGPEVLSYIRRRRLYRA